MSINKTKTKNPKYNKKNSRPIFGRAKYITKNYKTIKSHLKIKIIWYIDFILNRIWLLVPQVPKDENVKSLRRRQRTKFDQKDSLKPSAQVS